MIRLRMEKQPAKRVRARRDRLELVGYAVLERRDLQEVGERVELHQLFGREGLADAVPRAVGRRELLPVQPVDEELEGGFGGVGEVDGVFGAVESGLRGCGVAFEAFFVFGEEEVRALLDAPLLERGDLGGL